jgi:hypothetical protein
VRCESSLCDKHKSVWEEFSSYDLATLYKVLRARNPLLISEFTVEARYNAKIRDRIMKVLSLEKFH